MVSSTKIYSAKNDGQGSPSSRSSSNCRRRNNPFLKVLDDYLVGKNDPADFSKAWRKKFSKHPSWCDADMCLQHINMGNASGNRVALYSRALFQKLLFHLGDFVQEWPKSILVFGILFLFLCCYWLKDVQIETDLVKLWVEQGGRLDEEMNYLGIAKAHYQRRGKREAAAQPIEPKIVNKASEVAELPVETTFGGGFQVVIQTSKVPNSNILTREELLRHVEILEQIANYSIEMFGETWFLSDICFKPPPPATSKDVLAQIMEDIVAQIIPCVWITPIDCFWEGSKPLGPFPPLDLGPVAQFIPSIPNGQLEWKTLNPGLLLNSAKSLIDVGMVADLFDRAGIGAAYQDRACIDPLDPDCPKTAPNYFNRCKAYEIFVEWNGKLAEGEQIHLEAAVKGKTKGKRDTTMIVDEKNHTQANDDVADYYDNGEENAVTTESPGKKLERQKMEECEKYGHSFMEWIRTNRNKLNEFLPKELMPNYPNYGETMTGGCKGFGKNIMNWPEDLIVGGIKREANGFVQHAEAFQTVFLVASANDVHHRVSRSKSHYKSRLDKNIFTPGHAGALIQAWQRNFTRRIYEHPLNKLNQGTRIIHPLASTSIQDMLEQFSEFQFLTIFIGYVLMIFYAGWTQLQWEGWWFSPKSSCMLAVIGVLVITLASVAGLGLSTAMGIHFNAATTQIVPFLTLGLGIDDMFLLLHNYNDVLEAVKEKEVAVLLKETGMSILITSINNILAFMTGSILPIPALRSFCGQTAILLTSNVICIILLYPAFIALDLKRRKAGYRDMSFGYCCHFVTETTMEQPSKKKLEESSSRNQLVKSDSTTTTQHSEIDLQQMSEAVFGKNSPIKTKTNGGNGIATKKKRKWYTLSGFLYEIYIPLLRHPIAKATILLFCSAMFLFGCMGLYRSKIGLELADVLPEHTAPAAFLKAREKYFSFYPMFIVPKGPEEGVDYPHQQSKLEQLRADIAKSDFVIKIAGKPEPYWMMFMRAWLHSLQSSLDRAAENGLNATDELKKLAEQSLALNFTLGDDFYLARRLLCSKGLKYNCSESAKTKLIDSNDIIDPDGFYNYLTAWFHLDNMMYYVSQAAFFPTPPAWHFQQSDESVIPPTDPLIYSQIPFYMNGLTDTPAIVQMINQIRDICDRYTLEGLPIFPTGIPFTFWEQYLHLNYYLFTSILIIGTAVLLVISLIIFNPWAAAMVAIIVVSMTVELAGFMGLFGVKTNPISAVTLITAVGIGVEFTAHVVLAFLTSLGSRDERMVSCLEHMFIPVIHGGLSTLLGIIMLAFSEFDFVVKYFFVVMTALIIIGLINGLALLPVLLSLIGPPCEITPNDGSALLPCPPSARFRPEDSPIHSCFLPTTGENKSPDKNEKRNDESSASPEIQPNAVLKQHPYHESLSTLNETSGEESNQTKSSSSNTTNGARNSDMRF